jgi:hypothetical protein
MTPHRFFAAVAALCLPLGSAAADSTYRSDCNSVWERGHSRMVCSSSYSSGLSQSGSPSREEITYPIKSREQAEPPRTENFCGPGYRMAAGGCQAVAR